MYTTVRGTCTWQQLQRQTVLQQTADSTATRGCTDVTVSSLLLSLREGQTAQEAVLTWQFFSPPPFPGLLGLEARQLAMVLVLTAA